jgi:secondary thiamine-phosphate synthase enzyme
MNWHQSEIEILSNKRGFILVTDIIIDQIPAISSYKMGILNLFIKHTSASLTINENADPTVRTDMEAHFNHMVPENAPYYRHTLEGPDDMPAHLKSTIIGNTLSIPISNGQLNIGIWQGIYLCEHRSQAHRRKIVATIYGEMV